MNSELTTGFLKPSENTGARCAGGVIGAHLDAQQAAQCNWAPRADFLLAAPPLSAPLLPRPHDINDVVSWGRVKGRNGGLAAAKVGTLLGRAAEQQWTTAEVL